MSEDDRRRSPRISRRFMIRYRCPASNQTQWMVSPIKDFSGTGARFISECAFPIGTVLDLELQVSTCPLPIPLQGTVVWSKLGPGQLTEHGVTFLNPDAVAQQEILKVTRFFLEKNKP